MDATSDRPAAERAPDGVLRPFAAGDRLARLSSGGLLVATLHEKPGWEVRRSGDQIRIDHPGTPIWFEDRFYEVVRREGQPPKLEYHLEPWDDRFVLRQPLEYSAATCEAVARQRATVEEEVRTALLLRWTSPLVGLLPAPTQSRLADRFRLPELTFTRGAWVLLLAAGAMTLHGGGALLDQRAGTLVGPLPWTARWLPLALYAFLESGVRLWVSASSGQPVGSLPATLFDIVRRAVADGTDASRRAERRLRRAVEGAPHPELLTARDHLVRTVGSTHVDTLVPAPDWRPNLTGVEVDGRLQRVVAHARRLEGGWFVERYTLEPMVEGDRVQAVDRFDATAVRDRYRSLRRAARREVAETWAGLLGLLDGSTQERLAEIHGHDPERMTAIASGFCILAGAAATVEALATVLLGTAELSDLGMLALGLGLLVDGARRWRAVRTDAELPPSWLAPLVRPLARYLLDPGADPSTPSSTAA